MLMDTYERFDNMLLAMGLVLGSLRDPCVRAELVAALSHPERLNRHYVECLRDELTAALAASVSILSRPLGRLRPNTIAQDVDVSRKKDKNEYGPCKSAGCLPCRLSR